MSDHSLPEGSDFVIRQTNITAGNRTAGKSADKQVFHITSKFFADAGQVYLAVIDGGLTVAPPSHGVLFFTLLNVRHRDPDESFSSCQSVAEICIFDFPAAFACRKFIAGIFNQYWINLPLRPICREVEGVIDLSALVLGCDLAHSFTWSGFFFRHDGGYQVFQWHLICQQISIEVSDDQKIEENL